MNILASLFGPKVETPTANAPATDANSGTVTATGIAPAPELNMTSTLAQGQPAAMTMTADATTLNALHAPQATNSEATLVAWLKPVARNFENDNGVELGSASFTSIADFTKPETLAKIDPANADFGPNARAQYLQSVVNHLREIAQDLRNPSSLAKSAIEAMASIVNSLNGDLATDALRPLTSMASPARYGNPSNGEAHNRGEELRTLSKTLLEAFAQSKPVELTQTLAGRGHWMDNEDPALAKQLLPIALKVAADRVVPELMIMVSKIDPGSYTSRHAITKGTKQLQTLSEIITSSGVQNTGLTSLINRVQEALSKKAAELKGSQAPVVQVASQQPVAPSTVAANPLAQLVA